MKPMISGNALIIHPAPNDVLLKSAFSVCSSVIVLSPGNNPEVRRLDQADRLIQYQCAPEDDVVAVGLRLCHEHDIGIVLPVWEGTVDATAKICATLGLPGNVLSAVVASRDKYLAALSFERSGIPHPRTRLFDSTLHQATSIEQQFDYPLIVKLPQSTNSQSVTLVRSREELEAAFTMIERLYRPDPQNRLFSLYKSQTGERQFLVQSYIEGPELNIDLLYTESDHRVLGVFEKHPMTGPTFGEVQSVYPVNLSDDELNTCFSMAVASVRALGATIGAAHVEMRVTKSGPVVIEAALRPGGFLTAMAIRHLTGIDPIAALIELLLIGTLPDINAFPKGRSCLYGAVNSEAEGRICRISGVNVAEAFPDVLSFDLLKHPGDYLMPLPFGTDYHVARFMLAGTHREPLEITARSIRDAMVVQLGGSQCSLPS
jgi:biotin carboxylase